MAEFEDLAALESLVLQATTLDDLVLNDAQRRDYYTSMIRVAALPQAYDSLCWVAGEWLLLLSEQADEDFATYGYEIIGTAMAAAITDGAVPSGLGWYVQKFQGGVRGDFMVSVLTHPSVESKLRASLVCHPLVLDLSRLAPDNEPLAEATIQFVAQAHRLGLSPQHQLMLMVKLLHHLSPENTARLKLYDLILKGLVECGYFIPAFYWMQAYDIDGDEDEANLTYQVVASLVDHCLKLGPDGYQILLRLSTSSHLLQVVPKSRPALVLLCIVMLWLTYYHGFPVRRDLFDLAVTYLWGEFAIFTRFLQIAWGWPAERSLGMRRGPPPVEYLAAPRHRSHMLQEIRAKLEQKPNFRLMQLPADIWFECRDTFFIPCIDVLEEASQPRLGNGRLTQSLKKLQDERRKLEDVDLSRLISTSKAFTGDFRARAAITGHIFDMIKGNLEDHNRRVLDLADNCIQSTIAWAFVRELESQVSWQDLQLKCDQLIEKWPMLEPYIARYLNPLIEACQRCAKEADDVG